ncbi:MAG: DEAD/DEAH box helicase, partial [Lysobacterales bacterium]
MNANTISSFDQLGLQESLLKVLDEVGYETPSAIQAQTIPLMLEGRDVVGQAQTGTGKTAAFALPILSRLDLLQKDPQVLVLAPTRELAIQVAEAFQKYAHHMKGFHVLPIYGGQDYSVQIRALQRGVHVVVGTPGRVMDHIRRGTLVLDTLKTLVLDEGDEMLRMGFIDDVEWILEQTPKRRQIALFSATMPNQIRRIASSYLNNPVEVTVKVETTTAETIRQRFWPVQGFHKLDALTRILEAEPFDAMLIFVRTKLSTVDLSEKLEARGYASAPLNGDIQQNQRERTVERLKQGKLDIVVATDVAARGLDVNRISHVVNYDIPADTEAYVHRIGRTGRAGREGDAILFVTPREKRMLYAIESATRKKIEIMDLPSTDIINNKRIEKFKQRVTETLESVDLSLFTKLIEQYQQEHDASATQIAAALAQLLQGDSPFLLQSNPHQVANRGWDREDKPRRDNRQRGDGFKKGGAYSDRRKTDAPSRRRPSQQSRKDGDSPQRSNDGPPSEGMERFRLAVGHDHGIMPGNIVGAIANEADISGKNIGRINIYNDYTLVDLPAGMPNQTLNALKKIWVAGQRLGISRLEDRQEKGDQEKAHARGGKKTISLPKGKNRKKRDGKVKKKPKSRRP